MSEPGAAPIVSMKEAFDWREQLVECQSREVNLAAKLDEARADVRELLEAFIQQSSSHGYFHCRYCDWVFKLLEERVVAITGGASGHAGSCPVGRIAAKYEKEVK